MGCQGLNAFSQSVSPPQWSWCGLIISRGKGGVYSDWNVSRENEIKYENMNDGRGSSEQGGKILSESPAAQSKEPVIVTFPILCHLKSITPDLLRVPRTPWMQKLSIVNWPLSTPVKTLRKCRKRDAGNKMRLTQRKSQRLHHSRPNLSNLSSSWSRCQLSVPWYSLPEMDCIRQL